MYKYFYYKLYKLAKKSEKSWSKEIQMPQYVALFSFSILIYISLLILHIFLTGFFKIVIVDLSTKFVVTFIILIYIINYLLFVKNKRYLNLEKIIDAESSRLKAFKNTFFWCYIIFLIFIFLFVLPNLSKKI